MNTKKMIVDNEFLSQEQVADMVLNLSSEKMSKLLNGKIVPNDRVFYPTRPIIGTFTNQKEIDISNKVIVLIVNSSKEKDLNRAKNIANSLVKNKTIGHLNRRPQRFEFLQRVSYSFR